MEKEFVSYEQAVALKELGFEDDCMAMWAIQYPLKDFDTGAIVQRINKITIPHPIVSKFDVNIENNISKDGAYYALAPLKQQVFRWFREKYNLCSIVFSDDGDIEHSNVRFNYEIRVITFSFKDLTNEKNACVGKYDYKTYEEAENACIDKLIELAKNED